MALLGKFDINSDFTQFYLWGLIIMLVMVVLMTWVSPRGKRKTRGKVVKVEEGYTSFEGELID